MRVITDSSNAFRNGVGGHARRGTTIMLTSNRMRKPAMVSGGCWRRMRGANNAASLRITEFGFQEE